MPERGLASGATEPEVQTWWPKPAPIGLYRSTVADWVTPYVRPQENANRCGVRRVRFSAADGRGLVLSAPPAVPLSVSAWPYTLEDLEAARHDDELPRRDRITLNLDHLQIGVGGDNSWGHEVHREFRIANGRTYEWTFRIEPVRPVAKCLLVSYDSH